MRSGHNTESSGSSGSSDAPRIIEFVEGLISSGDWPSCASPTELQGIFTSLQAESQRVVRRLAPESLNELLLGLCELYGYKVIGQQEFASIACPVVSIELPFGIVVHGILLETLNFQFNKQGIVETILRIADEASFVLVLDPGNSLRVAKLEQVNVSVISGSYFENLIVGISALRYFWQVREQIIQIDAAFDQLMSFFGRLEVNPETVETTAKRLGLG